MNITKEKFDDLLKREKYNEIVELIASLNGLELEDILISCSQQEIKKLLENLRKTQIDVVICSLPKEGLEKYLESDIGIDKKLQIVSMLPEKSLLDNFDYIMEHIDTSNISEELIWRYDFSKSESLNINEKLMVFIIDKLKPNKRYDFIIKNKEGLEQNVFDEVIVELLQEPNIELRRKILFDDNINIEGKTEIEIREIVGIEFLKENFEEFVRRELGDSEGLNKQIELAKNIESSAISEFYCGFDFKLLNERYIEILGVEGIKSIAETKGQKEYCQKILNLTHKELEILQLCLEKHNNGVNTVPYNEMRCEVIDMLFNGEYKELIDNISDIDCLTEKQKKTISSIVQNKNLFKIKSIEELENYSEIKKVQCDEWIKSDDLNLKKLAILEKLFNQDYETIKKQCVDIEELNDENLKKYLQCVNMIMKCNDSQLLEDIYNECNEENSLDKMSINLLIRRQYGNEFNNGLFNIKDANEIEENVFEAGTDLKMIVHVELKHHANYEKAWNKEKKNGIDYFCASYIRSDMLGTFGGVYSVTYGYCNLKPESLGAASANDLGSRKECTIVRTPNGVINNTQNKKEALHNELNYQYFCDGKRQQPDYIVVFRHDGVINNMAEAKKAQKDWNGRLPIIIVDVNKCLESEKQKIEDMKQEYAKTKSPILARQIYQKICNNQKTIQYFKIQDWIYVKFLDTFFENFFIYMSSLSLLHYILNLHWYKWYTELLTSPFTPI